MATIDCICPPKGDGQTRHPDGDTVTLRERLDFAAGRAARYILLSARQDATAAGLAADSANIGAMGLMSEWYLIAGIQKWSVTDGHGKAVEPTEANIRRYLLEHVNQKPADDLADLADSLYSQAVIAPLQQGASNSSPPTSTSEPTSATTGATPPKKRSRPSSTTTSRTDGIVEISRSHDGDSSSSLSSA